MLKNNVAYEWEITSILTQDEVCLLCHLVPDEDPETQILKLLNILKKLI